MHPPPPSPGRFLCGTVNDFVAEVGKAYERATENKEEADAMAKKVNGFVCNGMHHVRACVMVSRGQCRCVCMIESETEIVTFRFTIPCSTPLFKDLKLYKNPV